ncbi:MAG: ABC transporter permease, partial [Bartonella sp.]|nr:ABC transporter permease [Bartonella sp.]
MNKSSPIFYIPKRIFTVNKEKRTPLIPSSNISGQALVAVIAIMTFLSSLTLISVDLMQRAANNWSSQISYEATIQIRPIENVDIEKNLHDAVNLVKKFHGVEDAKIVDQKATEK